MPQVVEKGSGREPGIFDDSGVIRPPQRSTASLLFEQYHPWLVALVAAFFGFREGYLHILSTSWSASALEKVNNIMGILAGYLVAVVALLPALEERTWMRKFRELGYHYYIVSYLRSALWSCLLSVGLTTATSFFSYSLRSHRSFDGFYSLVWWGV